VSEYYLITDHGLEPILPPQYVVPLTRGLQVYGYLLTDDPKADPEELPDDQIVPDNTDPRPPDPEVKTDPVDDE
jgi:hypothetical protein